MPDCRWIACVCSLLDHGEVLAVFSQCWCAAEWAVYHAAFPCCQNTAIAHQRHAARLERSLLWIEWQRQLADRAFVLLGPLAAPLHEHQLIPRGDALLASPDALPPPSLLRTVCAIRQLALASPADFHDPAGRRFGADGPVSFPLLLQVYWSATTRANGSLLLAQTCACRTAGRLGRRQANTDPAPVLRTRLQAALPRPTVPTAQTVERKPT